MFNPVFTIFKGANAVKYIEMFEEVGFPSLVCEHGTIDKKFKDNYYMFEEGRLVDDIANAEFIVSFNEGQDVDVDRLMHWMFCLFTGVEYDEEFDRLLIRPKAQKIFAENTDVTNAGIDQGRDYYDFDYFYHEKLNAMFYEVWKPFTDLPYTTVVYDFKTVGHEAFFTNLFICPSWGCKDDLLFLNNVWKMFKLKFWTLIDLIDDEEAIPDDNGVIPKITRLQEMVRTRAAHCLPGEHVLLSEPSVWRKPMAEVIKQIVENISG